MILMIPLFFVAWMLVAAMPGLHATAYAEDAESGLTYIGATENVNGVAEAFDPSEGAYGSGIRLQYATDLPYYRVTLQGAGDPVVSSVLQTQNGTIGFAIVDAGGVPIEGKVGVTLEGLRHPDALAVATERITVWQDTVLPPVPYFDSDTFYATHDQPFLLRYRLFADEMSGIDFAESGYRYEDFKGNTVIPYTPFAADYLEHGITIDRNGRLTFTVYDKAGNVGEISVDCTGFDYQVAEVPVITVDPTDGYAQEIRVAMTWGERYDQYEGGYRYYAVVTESGVLQKLPYKGPVTIDIEGRVEVYAYYKKADGSEASVSTVIENRIDKTPPLTTPTTESLEIAIDLTAANPLTFSIVAEDRVSGIATVEKGDGTPLLFDSGRYYGVLDGGDDLREVVLILTDVAGNRTRIALTDFAGIPYATIEKYAGIYRGLTEADYTAAAWTELNKQFRTLSYYLLNPNPSSSEINQMGLAIEEAVRGETVVTNRIETYPEGLSGDFTFDAASDAFGVRKGDKVTLTVNAGSGSAADLTAWKEQGIRQSGFQTARGFVFRIDAKGTEGAASLVRTITVGVGLPEGSVRGRVYAVSDDGTLTELNTYLQKGRLYFVTDTTGNFVYVVDDAGTGKVEGGFMIGGRYYNNVAVGVTAAVIVVVCVGVFFGVYFLLKKRK